MSLLGGYCILLMGAAMLGGWAQQRLTLSHTRMQTIISFVGGLMLGIAAFHMLPHSLLMLGPEGADTSVRWLVGGLLVMFFLLRMFHFHQHDSSSLSPDDSHVRCEAAHHVHEHAPHRHASDAHDTPPAPRAHTLSWMGVFLGLALHTLIDGLALGASFEGDASHGAAGWPGIGTFLAIFLHIPLDSISITSLMAASGYRPSTRHLATAAFALLCPIGAASFVFGMHHLARGETAVVGCALAFSAGVFLCIALSDLLPEMEFHSHNRMRLSLALLLGVAFAWAIGLVEPEYLHSHHHSESQTDHSD